MGFFGGGNYGGADYGCGGGYGYGQQQGPVGGYSGGCGNGFALIVVLFILLVIIGASYCK
ncbi:YjcZ family sporulation protein [Alkalicoccobacillus plakortidis]|uniref:YjcZ family sporulation protein n=1 Tax=Alkalicoccobacillus plakortidis TaxID=444060 RepID=A0ABT0XRH1_9BACI|nr:YjcZ family sporulation protein [Alkalicoccobacillus plakortidis]MCM2677892.1 YjcZ family sporulation protein [Alkalicoccobacillus plakortidis]